MISTDQSTENLHGPEEAKAEDSLTGDILMEDDLTEDNLTGDNEGNMTGDNLTENSLTEDDLTGDNLTEDNLTEDNLTENNSSEDNLTGENMTEDNMTENNPSEDNMTEDNLTENNPSEDNMTEDNLTEDNPSEDNPSEDNLTEDNPSENNPSEDNLMEDNPSENNPSEDNMTEEDETGESQPENLPPDETETQPSETDSIPAFPDEEMELEQELLADSEAEETIMITTAEELTWWLSKANEPESILNLELTADISLPPDFKYIFDGASLIIETGAYTLSMPGDAVLSCLPEESHNHIAGEILIRGEGVDGPVLYSDGSLSLINSVTIVADGRNEEGGTAVQCLGEVVIRGNTSVEAYGSSAIGVQCARIPALHSSSITVDGDGCIALDVTGTALFPGQILGTLRFSTIKARGLNSVSLRMTGDGKLNISDCTMIPDPGTGNSNEWTPWPDWNVLTHWALPSAGYHLPNTIQVSVFTEEKQQTQVKAGIQWDNISDIDFTEPGTYHITGTVSSCELSSLPGSPVTLTVEIGEDFLPVLSNPYPIYTGTPARLNSLRFPDSVSGVSDQSLPELWYSGDSGASWKILKNSSLLSINTRDLKQETTYLIVCRAEDYGPFDGISAVYAVNIHDDESFSFELTDFPPPDSLTHEYPGVSSWEELFDSVEKTPSKTTLRITEDLTVTDYVDLQSPGLQLDLGTHGITVKDGGWLLLYLDELTGYGNQKPLITVEPGGSLILGSNEDTLSVLESMEIAATGDYGVAVTLMEDSYLYAQKYPLISACGTGAVALQSTADDVFRVPNGLMLSAWGTDASALSTNGEADIFYTRVVAKGEGAKAVRAPEGAQITITSAEVSPMPENAVRTNALFLGFNQDPYAPLTLWKGAAHGMYLSEIPCLATVSRDGTEDTTEAVWLKRTWDSSEVDFSTPGSYIATARYAPLFSVELDELPPCIQVDVGIMNAKDRPDIGIIYPLPSISIGGMEPNYGFMIVCNAAFTSDIATLWCSEDNGKSWMKAESRFDVQFQSSIDSFTKIYVTGLEPEKSWLFRLDSTGQSAVNGPFVMAGSSDVRQVIIHPDSNITNIDWSGDRDGGDADGTPPGESLQPAPPSDSNENNSGKEDFSDPLPVPPEVSLPDSSGSFQDESAGIDVPAVIDIHADTGIPAGIDVPADTGIPPGMDIPADAAMPEQPGTPFSSKPVAEPYSQPLFYEYFGETQDIISGTRLMTMLESMGQIAFSKQGITVLLDSAYLAELNIRDSDRFSVTIEKSSETAFSYSVAVNDIPVSTLPGTKIMFPYPALPDGAELSLIHEHSKIAVPGSYDSQLKVAAFVVDRSGNFITSVLSAEESADPAQPADSSWRTSGIPWYLALFLLLVVFPTGCFLLLKRRHGHE